jgi:hypothetical protein
VLATYETQVNQLLQYPLAPDLLYQTSDIDLWINRARQQLAGESESIRSLGTVPTVVGTQAYNFSQITLPVSTVSGISAALHVRSLRYAVGAGWSRLRVRNWEWFESYELNTAVPPSGVPQVWAQYAQGEQGSFWISPIPDQIYTLTADCVCLPIDLVDDTTPEAIPQLWRDAVCYYAAYLALLSAQSAQRQNDAQRMFGYYTEFVERARRFATPKVNPYLYPQNSDPTLLNKIGLAPKQGAQG